MVKLLLLNSNVSLHFLFIHNNDRNKLGFDALSLFKALI